MMMTGGFLLSFYTKPFDGTFCRRLPFSLCASMTRVAYIASLQNEPDECFLILLLLHLNMCFVSYKLLFQSNFSSLLPRCENLATSHFTPLIRTPRVRGPRSGRCSNATSFSLQIHPFQHTEQRVVQHTQVWCSLTSLPVSNYA